MKQKIILLISILFFGIPAFAQTAQQVQETLSPHREVLDRFEDLRDTTEAWKESIVFVMNYAPNVRSLSLETRTELLPLIGEIAIIETRVYQKINAYPRGFIAFLMNTYPGIGAVYSKIRLQTIVDGKAQAIVDMENDVINALSNISNKSEILLEYLDAIEDLKGFSNYVSADYWAAREVVLTNIASTVSGFYSNNMGHYEEGRKALAILNYVVNFMEVSDIEDIWSDLLNWPENQLDSNELDIINKFYETLGEAKKDEYIQLIEKFFFLLEDPKTPPYIVNNLLTVDTTALQRIFSTLDAGMMDLKSRNYILNLLVAREYTNSVYPTPSWRETLDEYIANPSTGLPNDILKSTTGSLVNAAGILGYLEDFNFSTSSLEFELLERILNVNNVRLALRNVSIHCTDETQSNEIIIKRIGESLSDDYFDLSSANGQWINYLDASILESNVLCNDQVLLLEEVLFQNKNNASLASAKKVFGLDLDLYNAMWAESPNWSTGSSEWEKYIRFDLKRMYQLTQLAGEKAVRQLFQDGNITHFGRYPIEHLVHNFKNRSIRSGKPILFSIANKRDHNGAFLSSLVRRPLEEFFTTDSFDVRLIEPGTKEMAQKLFLATIERLGISEKSDTTSKVKIFYFSNHGSASGLRLKNNDPSLWDINDAETLQTFQLFGKYAYRPDIVVNACSTGDTTYLADPIAKVSAREMYGRAYGAASDAGGIYDITINSNGGTVSVEGVKFTGASTNVFDYRDSIKTLSLEEDIATISVFPNPATTGINVKVPLQENKMISLEIFDLNGRKIQAIRADGVMGENHITVPLNNFRSGVYFLRVYGKNISTHRIIKN